ncbi:hypothetical protein DACRYDRAFT_102654 [Dacryopinax primogenitus]|uniref:Uncharacterized protein n=1 Tax=Dacryopinax primogenitus (strain DJM 731) TaxID=1858805 RepID=M5FUK8_DACPD|nr:uncharacterized protein DACRYDRAFT_102654 [Dacryopinax primogenitus]EJT96936.1 hypothetical protein DACRYDRAFT_102654 [Dacryopinax primogenitus]
MPPRTRKQATQSTDSSDSAPQRPRRTTRSVSSSAPKYQSARPTRTRAPRNKGNLGRVEETPNTSNSINAPVQPGQSNSVSSVEQRPFQSLVVCSPHTPNQQPDTSEDRVEDLLDTANDSLQSLLPSGDILAPVIEPPLSAFSPKHPATFGLPPSSPPSRVPSSSTDSGKDALQAMLPPSKRLGLARPVRRPGMIHQRGQVPRQVEPERDPSLSPSSDPFGFFALERRLRASRTETFHRIEERIQQEADLMADEPSSQFSDGVPFASPTRRRRQEEESMAEVDAVLANVTNMFEPVNESEQEGQMEQAAPDTNASKKVRRVRPKSVKENNHLDHIPYLPERKQRAIRSKDGQENISNGFQRKRTTHKGSKSTIKSGKHDTTRKRQKATKVVDDEVDQESIRARQQRLKLFSDVDSSSNESRGIPQLLIIEYRPSVIMRGDRLSLARDYRS